MNELIEYIKIFLFNFETRSLCVALVILDLSVVNQTSLELIEICLLLCLECQD